MVRDRLLGSVCLQESNQLPVCFLKLCQESVQLSETVLIDEPRFDIDTGICKVQTTDLIAVIIEPGLIDRGLRGTAVTVALFLFQICLIAQAKIFSHLGSRQAECIASFLIVVPPLLVCTAGALFRNCKAFRTGTRGRVAMIVHEIVALVKKFLIIFHFFSPQIVVDWLESTDDLRRSANAV